MKSHIERIVCPMCGAIQDVVVEHTTPWFSFVHECISCEYIISESEWDSIDEEDKK